MRALLLTTLFAMSHAGADPRFVNPANPAPESVWRCIEEISVPYFNGTSVVTGTIQVNSDHKDKVVEVFKKLAEIRYPISSMQPVRNFGWSDPQSMRAGVAQGGFGNTSGYNYRAAPNGKLSNHSWGTAIDINPFCNPQTWYQGGLPRKSDPPEATYDASKPCAITEQTKMGRDVIMAFHNAGFVWRGRGFPGQPDNRDYQHFEIDPAPKLQANGYYCANPRLTNAPPAPSPAQNNNPLPPAPPDSTPNVPVFKRAGQSSR